MTLTQVSGEDWLPAPDGARIFFRWAAPDSGPPRGRVVLAHGYAEHSGRYDDAIAALVAGGYAVAAPDHRGHGRTAELLGFMPDLDAVVADFGRLASHTAVLWGADSPLFLMGHSMGGLMCALRAIRDPAGIAGIITIGAGVRVPPDIPAIMVKLTPILGRLLPKVPAQKFYDPTQLSRVPEVQDATRTDPLFYRGWLRAGTGAAILRGMQTVQAQAQGIRTPVLVIHGRADALVPPDASQFLHATVSSDDKELHIVDEARHEVLHEPEGPEVLALIVAWLDRHA